MVDLFPFSSWPDGTNHFQRNKSTRWKRLIFQIFVASRIGTFFFSFFFFLSALETFRFSNLFRTSSLALCNRKLGRMKLVSFVRWKITFPKSNSEIFANIWGFNGVHKQRELSQTVLELQFHGTKAATPSIIHPPPLCSRGELPEGREKRSHRKRKNLVPSIDRLPVEAISDWPDETIY